MVKPAIGVHLFDGCSHLDSSISPWNSKKQVYQDGSNQNTLWDPGDITLPFWVGSTTFVAQRVQVRLWQVSCCRTTQKLTLSTSMRTILPGAVLDGFRCEGSNWDSTLGRLGSMCHAASIGWSSIRDWYSHDPGNAVDGMPNIGVTGWIHRQALGEWRHGLRQVGCVLPGVCPIGQQFFLHGRASPFSLTQGDPSCSGELLLGVLGQHCSHGRWIGFHPPWVSRGPLDSHWVAKKWMKLAEHRFSWGLAFWLFGLLFLVSSCFI